MSLRARKAVEKSVLPIRVSHLTQELVASPAAASSG